MAFLIAPSLGLLNPLFTFNNHITPPTPRYPSTLSMRYTAQTPLNPSHQPTYPQRHTNFFRDTTVSHPIKPTFPSDIDQLLEILSNTDRFIPVWNEKLIVWAPVQTQGVDTTEGSLEAVFWTPARLKSWLEETRQNLGSKFSPLAVTLASDPSLQAQPTNYFAVDVSISTNPPIIPNQSVLPLRPVLQRLRTETHAVLLAHANALLSWHASAVFCSRCGHPTIIAKSGTARACNNEACRTRNIYPRIMPSVLVLVLRNNGEEVLLGRKASWAKGRYSLLAGFSEIFECLEQTVVREVFEETGVQVDPTTICYHSSQPWPNQPHACLMGGFRAYVTEPAHSHIRVDHNELEDARWFEKSLLRKALESPSADGPCLSIPGPTSLSNRLIQEWLHETVVEDDVAMSNP